MKVAEGSASRVMVLYWPAGLAGAGRILTNILILEELVVPLPSTCCSSWMAEVATSACRWLMARE